MNIPIVWKHAVMLITLHKRQNRHQLRGSIAAAAGLAFSRNIRLALAAILGINCERAWHHLWWRITWPHPGHWGSQFTLIPTIAYLQRLPDSGSLTRIRYRLVTRPSLFLQGAGHARLLSWVSGAYIVERREAEGPKMRCGQISRAIIF